MTTPQKPNRDKKKRARQAKQAVSAQLNQIMALKASLASVRGNSLNLVEEPPLGDAAERFEARIEERLGSGNNRTALEEAGGMDTRGLLDDPAVERSELSKPSKSMLRKTLRMTVEQLKLAAPNPALVELHDANAPDPLFLVHLKVQRNSIPVPRHWIQKSLFLKNQIDREASDEIVPSFIENTGVAAMRLDDGKADPGALARPFIAGHPKLPLTPFGDVFYEGKDMRARFRRFRPGVLSERLRQALGMTMNSPPPWLYGMQRIACLPPAYPFLKVPGLNAPLPPGCRWGKSRGEWGEPPRLPDNSLVFPGVLREVDDASALSEAAVGFKSQYWGTLNNERSILVVSQREQPKRPQQPREPQAPPPLPKVTTQSFVPTPSMMPQFPSMQPSQTVFAQELNRYSVGYAGGGLMPSQYVFGTQPPPQYIAPPPTQLPSASQQQSTSNRPVDRL